MEQKIIVIVGKLDGEVLNRFYVLLDDEDKSEADLGNKIEACLDRSFNTEEMEN
jgi:uncharacterized OB-fold protein